MDRSRQDKELRRKTLLFSNFATPCWVFNPLRSSTTSKSPSIRWPAYSGGDTTVSLITSGSGNSIQNYSGLGEHLWNDEVPTTSEYTGGCTILTGRESSP
uniref:Uncharacterized protein n=1 Tax=Spongospora subterranea TaxID=70186 RepID=A0A0H5R6F3_9EUKA|eukprot:CRZ03824.1 hypothetical protein [Spongospora subterranea]